MKKVILITLIFLLNEVLAQSSPSVLVSLHISDLSGKSQELQIGLDSAATNGTDTYLGEYLLPPVPPSEIFDARLILPNNDNSLKDFRMGNNYSFNTYEYILQYQVESGKPVKISLDLPNGVMGRIQDRVTGNIIDTQMVGSSYLIITNPEIIRSLKMNISYLFGELETPHLQIPLDNSAGVSFTPLLRWNRIEYSSSYELQIATDEFFTNLVYSNSTLTDTSTLAGTLNSFTKYFWRVRGRNIKGNSAWSEVWEFTTRKASINAPTNLDAISPKIKRVNLSWDDKSDNETNFVIQRKTGDSLSLSNYANVAVLPANQMDYTDTTDFQDTTRYTYRVYATNADTVSDYSNQAEVLTIVPVELTSFTLIVNKDNVLLKWATATEKNNRGFEIERKLMGNAFAKIFFVEGKGTSTEKSDYKYKDDVDYTSYRGEVVYRLKQIDYDGSYYYSEENRIEVDFTPKEFQLEQNYPNPFNPTTIIAYELPAETKVTLEVYSVLGERVATLENSIQKAGSYKIEWNAKNLSSGVYIYRISAGNVNAAKKLILMK